MMMGLGIAWPSFPINTQNNSLATQFCLSLRPTSSSGTVANPDAAIHPDRW